MLHSAAKRAEGVTLEKWEPCGGLLGVAVR